MANVIAVAQQGDLVVAIGRDSARRLAKISSTLIELASPVFEKMLNSSFKEGQTIHDEANPLLLPDDDPTATLNLFHILHYHGDRADKTKEDWIQKLIVVGDKYDCTTILKEYVNFNIVKEPHFTIDRLIISGLTGDKEYFDTHSWRMVRMTEKAVIDSAHAELLELLPENMLDEMKEYRTQARANYRCTAMTILQMALNHRVHAEISHRFQTQLTTFLEQMLAQGALTKEGPEVDSPLVNMPEVLIDCMSSISEAGNDEYCRGGYICACKLEFENAMDRAHDSQVMGTDDSCKICFECFHERAFNLLTQCAKHKKCTEK